ncbi:MAG: hypothetical protein HOK11_06220 [Rhodospirillaceae bacterium]|jgi:hypothetical protein|nr:hypothetical protein [Rhodospirillaceae bacterium]MBT6404006.1 hypothetical protein [Rhodospirillaceae bacterium]
MTKEPQHAPDRFFYHSFPRPPCAPEPDAQWKHDPSCIQGGLKTLHSIEKIGLLLTPERFEIPPEHVEEGPPSAPIPVYQKRLCFTVLSPPELATHAAFYGPFALEFDLETLRQCGAMPAIYVTGGATTGDDFSGFGLSLLHRINELRILLDRLDGFRTLPLTQSNPLEQISFVVDEKVRATRCNVGGLQDIVDFLELQNREIRLLLNSIHVLASLFKPTEDFGGDDWHSYYEEREWRIIDGLTNQKLERGTADELSDEEKSLVLETVPSFANEIEMRLGTTRKVDSCIALRTFQSGPFYNAIRRVIVPHAVLDDVVSEFDWIGSSVPIVALEDI